MELRRSELVMRYMLTTRVIALADIVSVTPTDSGLTVETLHGAKYNSPAFIGGKSPLATWLRLRSRADGIASVIMAAARSKP